MKFKMKCLETFKDGNIFRRQISAGEVIEVEGYIRDQIKQSAPHAFETLGMIVEKEHVCSECGFEAKSALGLSSHVRHKHGDD